MSRGQVYDRLCLLLFFLLTCSSISDAALPALAANMTPAQKAVVEKAIVDGITLARAGALFFGCAISDPYYSRYFAAADETFVKHMFRSLAAVPADFDASAFPNPGDFRDFLNELSPATLNDKFAGLSVSYGNHPSVSRAVFDLDHFDCAEPTTYGHMVVDEDDEKIAWMSLCPQVFTNYYSIHDTLAPSAALAGVAGLTCDGLGDHEIDYMETPGLSFLHELMHWPYLFEDVPGYDTKIRRYGNGVRAISDYLGTNPPNGLGAFYAHQLRNLPDRGGFSEALNNAENYAWFAAVKFWSWACGDKFFGPAISQQDFARRYNPPGQPPPPAKRANSSEGGRDRNWKRRRAVNASSAYIFSH